MKRACCFLALLFCIAAGALGPIPASAQAAAALGAAPAVPTDLAANQALHAFMQAMYDKNYALCWALLTAHSQDAIVEAVANDEHLDRAAVTELFDANSPRVVDGFWTSFRNAMGADKIDVLRRADTRVQQQSQMGGLADVQFVGYAKSWKMFREGGRWKVGYMETWFAPASSK